MYFIPWLTQLNPGFLKIALWGLFLYCFLWIIKSYLTLIRTNFLKLVNMGKKLILSKVQVNKSAPLYHLVPLRIPLILRLYSIVKRCYFFFDQATQIFCRFFQEGRDLLHNMPGNFWERVVISEKRGVTECHHYSHIFTFPAHFSWVLLWLNTIFVYRPKKQVLVMPQSEGKLKQCRKPFLCGHCLFLLVLLCLYIIFIKQTDIYFPFLNCSLWIQWNTL